jgi:tetratricopeptide (TPR) repeat protein
MNYDEVERCLKEEEKLLERYRDKIIERRGEEGYYHSLAVLENKLGSLALSLCKFDEAEIRFVNDLKASLKAGEIDDVAVARFNLALVKMLRGEFRRAVGEKVEGFDLYDAIEIFKKIGDLTNLSKAEGLTLLASVHGCKVVFDVDLNALKDSYSKAWLVSVFAYLDLLRDNFEKAFEGFKYAFETFKRLNLINRFIPLVLMILTQHKAKELSFAETLVKIKEVRDDLKKRNDKLSLWAIENLLKALEREGLSDGVLKNEVLKLLLV